MLPDDIRDQFKARFAKLRTANRYENDARIIFMKRVSDGLRTSFENTDENGNIVSWYTLTSDTIDQVVSSIKINIKYDLHLDDPELFDECILSYIAAIQELFKTLSNQFTKPEKILINLMTTWLFEVTVQY